MRLSEVHLWDIFRDRQYVHNALQERSSTEEYAKIVLLGAIVDRERRRVPHVTRTHTLTLVPLNALLVHLALFLDP
jgi:hypothetical protein